MSHNKIFKSLISVLLALLLLFSLTAVFVNADSQNFARGKAYNASSTLIMAGCNYSAANVLDGDFDTSWYADPAADTAFYEVDFGGAYALNRILIYWGIYDYATDFSVSLKSSPDGDWAAVTPVSLTNTMYQAHYVTEITLDAQACALRIDCQGKNDWSYEIFEIECYSPEPETDTAAPSTQPEPNEPESTQPESTQPESGGEPYQVSRTENHAYLDYEWTKKDQTDAFINSKLDAMEENGIKYLFCDVGCYYIEKLDDGEYRLTKTIKYAGLAHWIREAHERGMYVSAWVNFSFSEGIFENVTSNVTFGTRVKNQIVNLSNTWLLTGLSYGGETYYCDGVHLDAEPFDTQYQDYFITLITAISRVTRNADKQFSLYAPAKNGVWTNNYLRRVIKLVDMINPALYDTNGPVNWGTFDEGVTQTAEQYRRLCKQTCIWYSDNIALSGNPDCLLSPTFPVYDDRKLTSSDYTQGFPVENTQTVYYHLNYNFETGEELESLENGIAGVNEAANLGARVYSAGIFYWPAFAGDNWGYRTAVNPYYNSADDRADWQNDWLLIGE